MTSVPVRELRNHTRQVLDRVSAGESVVITVDGRPTAELRPLARRSRRMDRATFVGQVLAHQADPGLTVELADLAPDMTDELPWP